MWVDNGDGTHTAESGDTLITEKNFTSFESNVGWNYGHDSRGYEFKFKIGDDYFIYYDINKDGWIDFTEEK